MNGFKKKIHKPIFIVGCGRSGTTIFYEIMAWHKDLAWISNYSNWYYSIFPYAAGLCVLYRSDFVKRLTGRRFPKPREGHRVWDWCHPVFESPNDPPLDESDVTPKSSFRVRKMVIDHIRYSGKKRFINKNTRNSRRIRYLNAIFPDAKFIHIIRDGRAVVASLNKFREKLTPWILKENENLRLEDDADRNVEIAALLWMAETNKILNDKEDLHPSQYCEIKYEDLMRSPVATMKGVCRFCELNWSDEYAEFIKRKQLKNFNYRFKERLTDNQISKVEKMIRIFSHNLGYKLD